MEIAPYNPLDLEALGDSLLRKLESSDPVALDQIERFVGPGIYGLYYVGDDEPYRLLSSANHTLSADVPLYIGRSRDSGARRGGSALTRADGLALWSRMNEHRRSIRNAINLNEADFAVRVLVVLPVWITLAEAVAIRRYQPIWNSELSGFGIHAPGRGRAGQARSDWDVLHPGRGFAGNLTGTARQPRDQRVLLERTRRAIEERLQKEEQLAARDQHLPSRHGSSDQRRQQASRARRSRSDA